MKSFPLLSRYLEERNQLLRSIIELLERDPNVKAAWLFGSLGRGDEDALSDLDLWVVAEDDRIHKIITQLREYTSQIGQPVLFLEAPQNAPEGGAYLMTCYDAPVAPHIVDWYWQPRSLAKISGQVRLLFDRASIIHQDQPIHFSDRLLSEEILDSPVHFISYFWMMLMIAAKHASRSPWAEEMELLPLLLDPFEKANHFIGQNTVFQSNDLAHHLLPSEKVQVLYQLANQMSVVMDILSEQGEELPASIKPGVYRYLNLIDWIMKDKEE